MKTIKFITILATAFFLCLAATPAPARVSFSEAGETARNWIAENFDSARASTALEEELKGSEIKRNGETAAYSFEPPGGGFVLVSGLHAERVIAFSETNSFNPEIPAVAAFLDSVYLSGGDTASRSGIQAQTYQRPIGRIGPLLRTQWNQRDPDPDVDTYNFYCPVAYSAGDSRRAPAGCVAVAIGQIMRYHRHPPRGYGSHEYDWDDGRGSVTSLYADFNYPYDWNSMPPRLFSGSTEREIHETAKLLYHIGVAVEMQYGYASSGAFSVDVVDAIIEHFDYRFMAEWVGRDFDTEQWFQILAEEIINDRPVYYDAIGAGRHAFVLDGIDDTGVDTDQEIRVHLNYGWGGDSDGWYDLNFFHAFTMNHHTIIGIVPAYGSPGGGRGGQPRAPSGTDAPGSSTDGGCFIATAAFGSYDSPDVLSLRNFRDGFLMNSRIGRVFTNTYYNFSPVAGEAIRTNRILRAAARLHLAPVILAANILSR